MTALETRPPFRAEHIGSLLRPAALKTAYRARQTGDIDAAAYQEALDKAVTAAVRMQETAGLPVITDGEFRRPAWSAVFDGLEGFSLTDSAFSFQDGGGDRFTWRTCCATGPIRRRERGMVIDELDHVRRLTTRTAKVTLPSPSAFHFFSGGAYADPAIYPDESSFFDALIAIFREEIAVLAARGMTYLQLDEVPLAMLCDPNVREQARGLGFDPERLVGLYVDLVNRALADRPAGLTVGMHLCRGNFRSRWMAAGGYEPVAERLFNDLAVDAFFLEFDSPRAGGFEPLAHMPADKHVVLGLISTKTPVLEEVDALARRIDAAARFVPMERLSLSPQCGFASVAGGNDVSEDDQRAKLARVVEAAAAVWGGD